MRRAGNRPGQLLLHILGRVLASCPLCSETGVPTPMTCSRSPKQRVSVTPRASELTLATCVAGRVSCPRKSIAQSKAIGMLFLRQHRAPRPQRVFNPLSCSPAPGKYCEKKGLREFETLAPGHTAELPHQGSVPCCLCASTGIQAGGVNGCHYPCSPVTCH